MNKRLYALAISLMMLLAIPGLLAPTATAAPVGRDQYVQLVIQRGLAQRGVPYAWAGGDINGPTLGKGPSAAVVGFDASGLIQYIYAASEPSCPGRRPTCTKWASTSPPTRRCRVT